MYIDCLWVAGSLKGHGYSTDLLNACIADSKSKRKKGLCILAAAKKKPFLADPKFLKYKGFRVSDEAANGIQLWYLPFEENAQMPQFKECAKQPHTQEKGYVAWRRKNPLRHLCLQPGGFFLQGNLHQYGNDAVPMACPQWSGSGRRRLSGEGIHIF